MLLWRVVKSAQRRTAISTWKRIPHHVVKMTIGNGVFYLFFDWSIKSRVAYMRVLQSEWIPNSCEWPRTSIGGRQRKQKRAVNRMADVAHKMLGRKQWHGICVLPPKTFGRIFLFLLCSFCWLLLRFTRLIRLTRICFYLSLQTRAWQRWFFDKNDVAHFARFGPAPYLSTVTFATAGAVA